MVKEICNALIEADVNIKLVAGLRNSIKRTVNFNDQSPGVNKKRLIQKVWNDHSLQRPASI
jgi:signal recognition particle subunit SRP54